MPQIIDLDAAPAAEARPESWWAYRRERLRAYPLWLLGLMAFGAGIVVGGGGVYAATAPGAEPEAPAAVDLMLVAREPGTVTVADGEARASSAIIVSNTGTAAVVVHGVSADSVGVRLTTDEEGPRLIRPGGSSPVDVTIRFDCGAAVTAPVRARVLVESADGLRGEVTASTDLTGSVWQAIHRDACRRAG